MEEFITVITATKNIVRNWQEEDFKMQARLLNMQTYPFVEHLVIDGGSDDGTLEILDFYKEHGIIDYYSQPDKNKFEAYNRGIAKAKGKYILFLSCDDFLHDITALKDVVQLMDNDNAEYLFSNSYCRHPEHFVFQYVPSPLNGFQVMPCPRQAMIFRKSLLVKENGFDTNFENLSEFDLVIRLLLKKYKGIFFNRNYTTCKIGEKINNNQNLANEDAKAIFKKNYSSLYALNDAILNKMVTVSEFPQELLNKLAESFSDNKEAFYQKCEQMHKIRLEAYQSLLSNNQ